MNNTNVKLSVFTKGLATVWLYINRFSFVVPSSVLFFLFFTLLLNTSRGFDIADESYYLLAAIHPENILVSSTQFGYYTKWLYLLSGRDVAVFRILGILVLSSAAVFFAVALDRYWSFLSGAVSNIRIQWETITLILIGNLAFYHYYVLTPSYNWLALFSVLLVASGLLRVASSGLRHQVQSNWSKFYFIVNALLVGVGGGLSFLAKPSTAIILALITICWIAVHVKSFQCWFFWVISCSAACLVLVFHALSFKGGVLPFYNELRLVLVLSAKSGGGHTFSEIIIQAANSFGQFPLRIIKYYPQYSLLGLLLYTFVLWLIPRLRNRSRDATAIFVLSSFLVFSVLVACYGLWATRHWQSWRIGSGGLVFSIVLLMLAWLTSFVLRKNPGKQERIRFKNLIILFVFLLMLAFAFSFGTNLTLHRHMSYAYVFFAAAALYTGRWIDQYFEKRILSTIIPTLVALSVLFVMNYAVNHPDYSSYKINEMKVESTFLSGTGSLFVNKQMANYIKDLKRIALNAGWEPGTPLINLTGLSPGANFILGGRFLPSPILTSSKKYKGANRVVRDLLNMIPRSELDAAWILTAPNSVHKITEDILPEIGLNFPKGYREVGTAITDRDEFQVLWKPLNYHAGGSDVGL